MKHGQVRYLVTAALLEAPGPLTLAEVVDATGCKRPAAIASLEQLVAAGNVIEGELLPERPGPRTGH